MAARPIVSASTVPALLVCLAAPAFFVLLQPWLGWTLLVLGLIAALGVDRWRVGEDTRPSLARDLSLIALGLVVVSLIDLKAELDNLAMLRFTLALGGAVLLPYLVSRFVYRDHAIRFPWRGGGRWTTFQWVWLAAVLVLGWLILPFYFITSGVYTNWPVVDTPDLIARLFIGVGAVGIWDELFFICTCFALLRRHFADVSANALQTIVFVSFLWELGYRAWGPVLTIPFALLQGYIFLRTRSLTYVVTVHLLFDAVVFGVLVHAHNPGLLDVLFLVPAP
ncbi:CAAX protease family protein [Microbacterium sp. AISO3]|uniref:Peptidase n=1 Tax=Microbacterium arborescens TaxID=33883 RepID=A0ABX2WKY5_9MICO|nr:CAAX protease family protein [Microbacterium paludicola]OAZ43158.1 peptidase [Microbacterium arborescens]OWP22731.1 CAAX protease family protein [Microbacterium sp. AISO3]POX66691.1 CPBP family intramembrane metalloprotease [Microbacterium sp. Ru50]QCR42019.1 CPBP family intramembrane metalloprotease [Microbacterium sp. SGAir0570]